MVPREQLQRPRTRNTENVVDGALGTVKKGMIENIKQVSETAAVTEIQNICMLGTARILRKVLSV